jgi:hypothetical protein
MQRKAMDREVTKLIKEIRRKKKQDKQARKVTTTMTTIERVAERKLTRQQRANFITT